MIYDFPCHISGDTWSGFSSISIQTSGVPVNLHGSTVTLQIKPEYDIASPVFLEFLSTKGEVAILDPFASGNLAIYPKKIEIPVGYYRYELIVDFNTGVKKTYMSGKWQIISAHDVDSCEELSQPTDNIIIDDGSLKLNEFTTLITYLTALQQSNNAYTQLLALTGKWQETAYEMDTYVQPLTSKTIETIEEMDTIQNSATGNWQETYEYIDKGIIDAGYF